MRIKAIVSSMTKRRAPEARAVHQAAASASSAWRRAAGRTEKEVAELLQRFGFMQKMTSVHLREQPRDLEREGRSGDRQHPELRSLVAPVAVVEAPPAACRAPVSLGHG